MTASALLLPVIGAIAGFLCFMSLPLLAMAIMHMIGKTN